MVFLCDQAHKSVFQAETLLRKPEKPEAFENYARFCGFGHGGAISAITAHDHGAKTLILEKSSVPGGLSICSYGAVRSARDMEGAFTYLKATNGGRTPDEVNRALAQGMREMEAYVRDLARVNNAVVQTSMEENELRKNSGDPYLRRISGNYPLPGTEAFYHTSVIDVPGFDARADSPYVRIDVL